MVFASLFGSTENIAVRRLPAVAKAKQIRLPDFGWESCDTLSLVRYEVETEQLLQCVLRQVLAPLASFAELLAIFLVETLFDARFSSRRVYAASPNVLCTCRMSLYLTC